MPNETIGRSPWLKVDELLHGRSRAADPANDHQHWRWSRSSRHRVRDRGGVESEIGEDRRCNRQNAEAMRQDRSPSGAAFATSAVPSLPPATVSVFDHRWVEPISCERSIEHQARYDSVALPRPTDRRLDEYASASPRPPGESSSDRADSQNKGSRSLCIGNLGFSVSR